MSDVINGGHGRRIVEDKIVFGKRSQVVAKFDKTHFNRVMWSDDRIGGMSNDVGAKGKKGKAARRVGGHAFVGATAGAVAGGVPGYVLGRKHLKGKYGPAAGAAGMAIGGIPAQLVGGAIGRSHGIRSAEKEGLIKSEDRATIGRQAAGAYFAPVHGLVAGKKGHKIRAAAHETAGVTLGQLPGFVAGQAASRMMPTGRAKVATQLGALGVQSAGAWAGGMKGVRNAQAAGHYKPQAKSTASKGLGETIDRKVQEIKDNKTPRKYDPEHNRQRRLGAAQAGLGLGGAALLIHGGKGAVKTSRSAKRGIQAARTRDLAQIGGGTAMLGGAAAVNHHAGHSRGKTWN
jgi:hypothetical protein